MNFKRFELFNDINSILASTTITRYTFKHAYKLYWKIMRAGKNHELGLMYILNELYTSYSDCCTNNDDLELIIELRRLIIMSLHIKVDGEYYTTCFKKRNIRIDIINLFSLLNRHDKKFAIKKLEEMNIKLKAEINTLYGRMTTELLDAQKQFGL